MEHLWAPWRNSYVKQAGEQGCGNVFEFIGRSQEDAQHHVILRGKACFALLNAYPYNTAHTLIVPYREIPDLEALSDDELLEMMLVLRRVKGAISALFRPAGFNIGLNLGEAAGAGIPKHLHWHLVPRWRSDVNFMTVTGDTRVHPSDLDTIYQQLVTALAAET
jgi:ATP adenylyltransferase